MILDKDKLIYIINQIFFMKKSKNTWGGARNYPKGTGLRVSLTCRIDPATMTKLEEISASTGMSKGKIIDELVKGWK